MIRVLPTDAAGMPTRWILAFQRSSPSWWVRALSCGRYKHVRAFGYVADLDAWLFFDLRFRQMDIWIARGAHARALMARYIDDCDLIGMPVVNEAGTTFRAGFWCVPAIKHLIGLRSGALRPDTLLRDCLRNGAEIISDVEPISETRYAAARPEPAIAGTAGADRQDQRNNGYSAAGHRIADGALRIDHLNTRRCYRCNRLILTDSKCLPAVIR
jgi:hypothetical protein